MGAREQRTRLLPRAGSDVASPSDCVLVCASTRERSSEGVRDDRLGIHRGPRRALAVPRATAVSDAFPHLRRRVRRRGVRSAVGVGHSASSLPSQYGSRPPPRQTQKRSWPCSATLSPPRNTRIRSLCWSRWTWPILGIPTGTCRGWGSTPLDGGQASVVSYSSAAWKSSTTITCPHSSRPRIHEPSDSEMHVGKRKQGTGGRRVRCSRCQDRRRPRWRVSWRHSFSRTALRVAELKSPREQFLEGGVLADRIEV